MPELVLKNIDKVYDNDVQAVFDFNLEIKDKDFIVLVGPSGCGKSTTLRMIAGLEDITEGELYIDDQLMNDVEPKDRDIAMVFQSYALYPHMTVYDNMAFGLKINKIPKEEIDKRVNEAAKILEIYDYLDRKPRFLSGGQRQRVALGRAIVRNSKLFLMDEPLSNLDAKLREHMRVELVRLHKSLGTTTIYVTHDQTEAMTMASLIVLMDDGKIQQSGNPEEFYNQPANLFVAGFIGSPTMNIIEGKMENGVFKAMDGLINITPTKDHEESLKAYEGKGVSVGIRSERFETGGEGEDSFVCHVDVIEMLGKEKLLYAKLENGFELVISVPGHYEYAEGEEHNFGFEKEALHFFDTETGMRIN